MMRGTEPGVYADKDLVVVTDHRSSHYGAIGLVEKKTDQVTDLVHFGPDSAAVIQPRHIRRVRPGDRVTLP